MVRKGWVAARDDDERKRLRKGEEGLAVKRLPKAAPQLLKRFDPLSEISLPGRGEHNHDTGCCGFLAMIVAAPRY